MFKNALNVKPQLFNIGQISIIVSGPSSLVCSRVILATQIFFLQFLRAKITQLVNMVFFMMQVCVQFIGPLLGIEYRLYVMRCAIRDQSLFDVCMDVRTHVNAC